MLHGELDWNLCPGRSRQQHWLNQMALLLCQLGLSFLQTKHQSEVLYFYYFRNLQNAFEIRQLNTKDEARRANCLIQISSYTISKFDSLFNRRLAKSNFTTSSWPFYYLNCSCSICCLHLKLRKTQNQKKYGEEEVGRSPLWSFNLIVIQYLQFV